jgi:hypothetical protein
MSTERERSVQEEIRAVLEGQPFGVLCTQGSGQPYGSVVAYAYDGELNCLAFATPVDTVKYRLLVECHRVALVIDTRSQYPDDAQRASAVTATGSALCLWPGVGRKWWRQRLIERHAQLASFYDAPSSALFRVDVERYKLVTRFQEVRVWEPWEE